MENTLNYNPHKSGFPFKALKYLFENGTSSGTEIQEKIGLNNWADNKGPIFFSRSYSYFNSIIINLKSKELIKCLPDDFYELTEGGKNFMSIYIKLRRRG